MFVMPTPGQRYTPAQTLSHSGEMLLLDEVLDYNTESVSTRVHIRRESPFCEATGVPAWVGMEYMAQTIGVYSGIERLQQGEALKIGFLIGTRRYDAAVPFFTVGKALQINARLLLWGENNLFVFDCDIHDGERKLAAGEIKAFRPEDVHAYLKENA